MIDLAFLKPKTPLIDLFPDAKLAPLQVRLEICTTCGNPFHTVEYFKQCNVCRKPTPTRTNVKCLNCSFVGTFYNNDSFCGTCHFKAFNSYQGLIIRRP